VVAIVEGRGPVHHFENEDAECPPVCHEGLSFACDDLRT
jgi:hypothetical protein